MLLPASGPSGTSALPSGAGGAAAPRGDVPRPTVGPSPIPGPDDGAAEVDAGLGVPRAELVCRRYKTAWVVEIEVNDEHLGDGEWEAECAGVRLTGTWGRWKIPRLSAEVTLRQKPEGPDVEAWPGLPAGQPLVFRLNGSGTEGRRVPRLLRGPCLVMTPREWVRLDGTAEETIEPEQVLVEERLVAHYCDLGRSERRIVFRLPGGSIVSLQRTGLGIELDGPVLPDGSVRMGPLFGPEPPDLKARDAEDWAKVGTIVVGQEGPGRRRWRTHFRPAVSSATLHLPVEVRERQAGWFFVRIYSREAELLESMDFRFASGVDFLGRSQPRVLPGSRGHSKSVHCWRLPTGWSIRPTQDGVTGFEVRVCKSHGAVVVVVPPIPEADNSSWLVVPPRGEPGAPLNIVERRAWWAVAGAGEAPRWTDRPVRVRRDWFRAASDKVLYLKLPEPARARVGFDQASSRQCGNQYRVGPGEFKVPLRDFAASPEVESRAPAAFTVWLDEGAGAACMLLERLRLRCAVCSWTADGEAEMTEHVKGHLEDFFPRLSWDEVLRAFPEREYPSAIYQCGYNPEHYVPADRRFSLDNPTFAITWHIQHGCPDAVPRSDGVVVTKFTVVTDLAVIRKVVRPDIPDFKKCRLCPPDSRPFENPSRGRLIEHLLSVHRNQLWSRVEE